MRGVSIVFTLLLLMPSLRAEDEQRVVSPNGEVEFRLFTGQPAGALWPRVGYQVSFRGKPLLAPSWLGLDIRDQEPFLGENPGFMSADKASDEHGRFNSVVAHYMQNGSLGRRLDVEVRAYDDGVAFRYVIPKSTQIADILIRDEATEFNFAPTVRLDARPDFDLPLVFEAPGVGWIEVADSIPESKSLKYPRTYLVRSGAGTGLIASLARSPADPTVAFAGTTPLVWPWRVVLFGADREGLAQSGTLRKIR